MTTDPIISDREIYGRSIAIWAVIAICDACGKQGRCLAVDTSDGEYLTAYICRDCGPKIIEGLPE